MPDSDYLRRYDEVARLLTEDQKAVAKDGVKWIQELCADLAIPGLASYGLVDSGIPDLIQKASVASSMQGNPIKLTMEELEEIVKMAM
jgi:alcohol dehydrogenase class IV